MKKNTQKTFENGWIKKKIRYDLGVLRDWKRWIMDKKVGNKETMIEYVVVIL